MTMIREAEPKVIKTLVKGHDLELKIATVWMDNLQFVEIRDFIPSTGEYGKGAVFPLALLGQVLEALQYVEEYNSTAGARPGAGQQKLPGM